MEYKKPFRTYEEQAEILIDQRGMVADRASLIEHLQDAGYYRLSGYWHIFKQPDDTFREGLGLDSTVHNSKLIRLLPDKENPLREVNRLCFLLELFLDSHSGFDREDLDGYLNLFWVAMNPPEDKLEKVAAVLDRAMRCPNTLRFRGFYNVRSRSND